MEHKHSDKLDINGENGNQSGPISTSKFLDFLKLACRVHESIILKDDSGTALDFNALAQNELVNALVNSKSGQSPKSNGADDGGSNDKIGEWFYWNLNKIKLKMPKGCSTLQSFHITYFIFINAIKHNFRSKWK